MRKHILRVSETDAYDGNIGMCTECGSEQMAEADALNYRCEACGKHTVQGMLELVMGNLVIFTN